MEGSRQPDLATTESFSYSWLTVGNSPKPNQIHQEDQGEEFMFSNMNDDHGCLSLEIDRYPSFSARRINRIYDDYDDDEHHHESAEAAAAAENFNFNVFSTIPAGHPSFSDANTLFSNGLIMTAADDNNNNNNNNCTVITTTGTIATTTTTSDNHDHGHHQNSSSGSSSSPAVSSPPTPLVPNHFRKLGQSSRKIMRKYLLGFLNPSSCKKGSAAVCSRRSIRVEDLDKRVQEVQKSRRVASNYIAPAASELRIISSASSPRISTATSMGADTESPIYEAIMYCKRSSTAD